MSKGNQTPSGPVATTLRFGSRFSVAAAALACALMYLLDICVLASVPNEGAVFAANFAVPFDLMVCVPFAFFFLFVRRRGVTPVAVLPAIYAGGAVSAAVNVPGAPSLLPALSVLAIVVDIVVLSREIPRLARKFRAGYLARKGESSQPIEWYLGGFSEVVPSKIAARGAAMEAAMWYWLAASWRRVPEPPNGATAFTYHRECGFVTLSCAIVALGLVETAVVHVAVSRISVPAALALSALSIYSLAWIAANARAAAKSPILVDRNYVIVVSGAFFCARIECESIERVDLSDPGLGKSEILDMSLLGGRPCWIVFRGPTVVEGIFGAKRFVRAVKLSPDSPREFAELVNAATVLKGGPM